MSKFVYKFEAIRQVKESLEKKAQKEVALIELEIDKLNKEYNKILEEENSSRGNFFTKNTLISEIKFKKNYEMYLAKMRSDLTEKISKLNNQKEIKVSELIQKSKEHKIFDSLEETLHENYKHEEKHKEKLFVDELATQKFIRQKK